MYKVKVAVVGPSQSGKTMISNFLADATDNIGGEILAMFEVFRIATLLEKTLSGEYRPTAGVRILEFESSGDKLKDFRFKMASNLRFRHFPLN